MLKSNVCDILGFSESCIHPLTIVSTFLLHQGDSYSGLKVNKKRVRYSKYKCF